MTEPSPNNAEHDDEAVTATEAVTETESGTADASSSPEDGATGGARKSPRWVQRLLTLLAFAGAVWAAFALGQAAGGGDSDRGETAPDDTTAATAPTTQRSEARSSAEATEYFCPMHPQIRQDEPGECPICLMELVPTEESDGDTQADIDPHAGHAHADGAGSATEYVCPMHPQIRQDEPGECPICLMELVPIEEDDSPESATQDRPSLRLSDEAAALARVQTARVERTTADRELEVFGRVAVDDSTEVEITAWAGGLLERLHADTVGERVRRGQVVARVHSHEIGRAQASLFHALANLSTATSEVRAAAAQSAVDAAVERLVLLGVSEDRVEEWMAARHAPQMVDVRAPVSGTIIERHAREGEWLGVGAPIVTVADLDRVWIILEIYERDLPRVEVGAPVSIRVPAVDGVELEGTIGFIYPTLDPTRRVARARVTVANDEGRLRPDMFVEATISTTGVDGVLTIPASAPLYTGNRALVYVATGEAEVGGVYEPREIRIGPRVGDRVVVLDGLHAGEEVVSRGAFRVDAELQIRGEPSMMSPRGDASSGGGHAH